MRRYSVAEGFTKTRLCDCKIFMLFHEKNIWTLYEIWQILSTHNFLVICLRCRTVSSKLGSRDRVNTLHSRGKPCIQVCFLSLLLSMQIIFRVIINRRTHWKGTLSFLGTFDLVLIAHPLLSHYHSVNHSTALLGKCKVFYMQCTNASR